jgi:hypothetical protein
MIADRPAAVFAVTLEADATQTALPAAARLRAALIGLSLGVTALATAAAVGFVVVAGPLHTSVGSLV